MRVKRRASQRLFLRLIVGQAVIRIALFFGGNATQRIVQNAPRAVRDLGGILAGENSGVTSENTDVCFTEISPMRRPNLRLRAPCFDRRLGDPFRDARDGIDASP